MNYQLTFELANASKVLLELIDKHLKQNDFVKNDAAYLIAKSTNIQTCSDVAQLLKKIIQHISDTNSQPITIEHTNILLELPVESSETAPASYDDCIEETISVFPVQKHK